MKRIKQNIIFLVLVFTAFIGCQTIQAETKDIIIGTGTDVSSLEEVSGRSPFGTFCSDGRSQYLIRKDELIQAGFTGGNIYSLAFDVVSNADRDPNNLRVSIGHTSLTSLPASFVEGLAIVYANNQRISIGWNELKFNQPFTWDGTSNIVIQVCFDNTNQDMDLNSTVRYSSTSFFSCFSSTQNNVSGCNISGSGQLWSSRPNMKLSVALTIDDYMVYWPFNGNANDATNTKNGTVNNATLTTDRFGNENSAYSFDGSYDYITMPDLNITTGQAFTISSWIKPSSANESWHSVMGTGNYTQRIMVHGTANKMLTQQDGNFFSADNSVNMNEWTQVIYWFNGQEERWYINGQKSGSSHATTKPNWDGTFYVGVFSPGNENYHFNGSIDDIRIYNRALSVNEIELLHAVESDAKVHYAKEVVNPVFNINPTVGKNYIHTIAPREAYKELSTTGSYRAVEQVQYFDGLGRPEQTIAVKASPTGADIITPFEYDDYGRQVYSFLPYTAMENNGEFATNAFTAQENFYSTTGQDYATDAAPWAETGYDNSPLNRVIEQGAPGTAWQIGTKGADGRSDANTRKIYYGTNDGKQKAWSAGATLTSITQDGLYPAGSLYVTQLEDEDQHVTKEYKDKSGRVVLKESFDGSDWLQTYYVYNDLGLLRCVIPPKAEGDPTKTELCYYYTYDKRHRMIEKKLPGAEVVSMVYNKQNWLVATQDGNMRNKGRWLCTTYDILGRPVVTFMMPSYSNHATMIERAETDRGYEERTSSGIGYTSVGSFSTSSLSEIISVTYYDDYSFLSHLGDFNIPGYNSSSYNCIGQSVEGVAISANQTGNVTGTITRTIDGFYTFGQFLLNVPYYDNKSQPIKILSSYYQGGTGEINTVTNKYSFTGELLKTTEQFSGYGQNFKLIKNYEYDHTGRLLEEKMLIDGDSYNGEVILAANKYNELGEVIDKYQHVNSSDLAFQRIDYKYNIRGWLTDINNTDQNTEGDLFGMQLLYNEPTGLGTLDHDANFNGNISAMVWKHSGQTNKKAYGFTYDALNRLTGADFGEGAGTIADMASKYNVSGISYDKNGNMTNITRYGESKIIDKLTFEIETDGNKLTRVIDNGGTSDGYKTYNDDVGYGYNDANGNMTDDYNKEVYASYNFMNLPYEIWFGELSYSDATMVIYDGFGNLIARNDKNMGEETIFNGSFVFKRNYNNTYELQYILTSEGRITKPSGDYVYEYHLKDHLGNTRVAYDALKTGKDVTQISDYYPFGMRHEPFAENNDNKYLYNGKEFIDSYGLDWYDYGARFYDAALGRWHVMDAMSEDAYSWSSYNYTFNNPISLIDPDGNFPIFGGSYLVNAVADGLSSMGAERASGFVRTYGNALIIDPVADAVDLVSSVANGNYGDAAKQMDPTGLSSIPDAVETVKAAANGDKEAQGSVAAGAVIAVANAKQGVKSLKGTNTSSTFRFDTRSPNTIKAEGGFKSWGKNMNLSEHASGKSIQNKTSGYVSTAKTEGAATTYAGGRKGYMYELKSSSKGVDVNKSLGKSSPFPNEMEIAVPRKIPADNILNSKPINQ